MGRFFCCLRLWLFFLLQEWTVELCEAGPKVDDNIHEILRTTRMWQQEKENSSKAPPRPFVTLSFAQSLDGKIAKYSTRGSEGAQVVRKSSNYGLSSPSSFRMTHALRSIHDGILVGGGTLEIDNPRLNNRLWSGTDDNTDGETAQYQPKPIILDTHLSHLQKIGDNCRLDRPIVCCSNEAASSLETLPANALVLPCKCNADGMLDLDDVLVQLWSHHGIRTIMVEGGASVLSSFLERELFDCVCVTVAPKLLGWGLAPSFKRKPFDLSKTQARFVLLEDDAILIGQRPL